VRWQCRGVVIWCRFGNDSYVEVLPLREEHGCACFITWLVLRAKRQVDFEFEQRVCLAPANERKTALSIEIGIQRILNASKICARVFG
jgi:hypothetical protein